MVNNISLDNIYSSLSDPTRREIILKIHKGTLNLQEVALNNHISLPAVSKHLKVLEKAKLIKRKKIGREYHFTLDKAAQYWVRQFQNLEAYLKKGGGDTHDK
jgi:DNA-binding transcriptional ArsR family regulator